MASAQMRSLLKLGRWHLYYAERDRFSNPGVVLWTGGRHVRVLPFPRSRNARINRKLGR